MENRFGLNAVENQNEFTEQAIEPKRQFEEHLDTPLTMGEYNAIVNIYQNSENKEQDMAKFASALEYKRNYGVDLDYAYNNIDALNEARGIPQEYNWSTLQSIKNSFKISALTDQLSDLNSAWMKADSKKNKAEADRLDVLISEKEAEIEGLRDYLDRGMVVNWMKYAAESSVFTGTTIRDSLTWGAGTGLALTGLAAMAGVPIAAGMTVAGITWASIAAASATSAKIGGTLSVAEKTKGTMYRELRKQGVERNLAKSAATINGYVNGLIETSLGVVPEGVGSVLRSVGVERIGAKTIARLAARGVWGRLGKLLAGHVMESNEEGWEEFFQSITDDVTDAIALTLSEECKANGVKFDKSFREIVSDAAKAYGQGFGAAMVMSAPFTALDARVSIKEAKQLKAEAKLNPSEESFVRNHMNDSVFEGVDKKDVKEMLREMYQNQNEVPADERIDESTIDSDTIEENVDIESEEDEAAVASEAPEKDIERMENGRLRTQEEKDYDVDIEGNEKHTLKVGTPNSSTRYGRVEYTVRKDGSIEIDKVATKAGYAKSVTKDAVLELMRRYAGQDVVWNPTNAYQQKIKTELENENNGTLQRFKSQYNQSEEAELGDYLHEKYKQITPTQGKILYKLYDNIAKAYGSTIHEMIQDAKSGNPKSALRFATMAEGVKSGAIDAKNAVGKRGAVDYANRIIYVGEHGDITTLFHEGFHILTKVDKEGAKDLVKSILESKELEGYIKSHRAFFVPQLSMTTEEIMKSLSNLSEDSSQWTEDQDEILTSLFEAYLRNGKTFSKELENIFSRIADFFIQIYKTLAGGKHLSDDIVKAFDQILEGNPELKEKYEAQEGTRFQSPSTEDIAEAERQYNEVVAKYKDTDQWLKAPNGQPTKLTERQWVQVRTPLFKAWFGDWENDPDNASKVVDPDTKEPMVVYHDTNAKQYINKETGEDWDLLNWKEKEKWRDRDDWDEYWIEQDFNVFDNRRSRTSDEIPAHFFTPQLDEYHEYGERTISAFLNIRKPAENPRWDYGISDTAGLDEKNRLIEEGYDGFFRTENGVITETNAFSPEQIKSATDNVGTFSQSNPSILFQSDDGTQLHDIGGTLVVTHNLTEDNVKGIVEIGGMPMPSIAITKPDIINDNFGDITLVGDKKLANKLMKKGEIFSRDMWSPTVPKPEYKVDKKALEKFDDWLISIPKLEGLDKYTTDNMSAWEKDNPQSLTEWFARQDFTRLEYCKEKGIKVDIQYRTPKYTYDDELMALARKWGEEHNNDFQLDFKDVDAFFEYLQPAYDEIYETRTEDLKGDEKAKFLKLLHDVYGEGQHNFRTLNTMLYEARNYDPKKKVVDTSELYKKLNEVAPVADVQKWLLDTKIDGIFSEPLITVGRKKLPYNAENIFKYMKKAPLVGDQKGSWVFGNSLAASFGARPLTTREAIAENEQYLSSDVGASSVYDDAFNEYHEIAQRQYKWEDTWDALNASNEALGNYLKYDERTESRLKQELNKQDIVPNDELIEAANNLVEALDTMARRYFEAKPQRVMQLSEFKYAIVPSTVSEQTKQTLADSGLEVVESDNRQEALTNLTNSHTNLLFQSLGEIGAEALDKAEESTYRKDNLKTAKDMEKEGKDAKAIKYATGWERGKDKKWRYEIDDFKKVDPFGNVTWLSRHPNVARYLELNSKANAYVLGLSKENLTEAEQKEVDKLKNDAEVMVFSSRQTMSNPNNLRIEDYIDAPELFKAYPELTTVPVQERVMRAEINGRLVNSEIGLTSADEDLFKEQRIEINKDLLDRARQNNQEAIRKLRSTLIHEIQHAIQYIEGFAEGGSPEQFAEEYEEAEKKVAEINSTLTDVSLKMRSIPEWDKGRQSDRETLRRQYNYLMDERNKYVSVLTTSPIEKYRRLAGEVEARNAQARMNMTPEERRATLLSETEDVAREDQIVLMDGLEAQMSVEDMVNKAEHTNLLFQSAYHGSGASFDKFDTDFMGTGEGAQAFGWGIYLSQSEGIARSYAENNQKRIARYKYAYYTNGNRIVDEDLIEALNIGDWEKNDVKSELSILIDFIKKEISERPKWIENIDKAIHKIEEGANVDDNLVNWAKEEVKDDFVIGAIRDVYLFNKNDNDDLRKQILVDYLTQYKNRQQEYIEWLEDRKLKFLESLQNSSFEVKLNPDKPRNLYTVTIPDDTGNNYLYWDKEYTEEEFDKLAERVIKANNLEGKWGTGDLLPFDIEIREKFNPTGEEIYHAIRDTAESPKTASEYLNRAGFVGIDYPANSMSGGNKYGKRNFVIFNADDIEIQTHIRYQNRLTEDERSQLVEEARDFDTFDDFLNYLSIMNGWLEPSQYTDALPVLDEIYSEAHGITRDKQKVELDLSGMTDDQKDRAFEEYIDGDGIKVIMSLLHDMYTTHYGYTYAHGALEDEEIAEEESLNARIREFEDNASSFIYNLAKSKKELTDKQFNSIRNVIKKNTRMYRELIADTLESETLRSDAEPDIAGVRSEGRPTLADREALEQDAKVTLDDKVEGEIEKKLTEVESELDKDEKVARALESEIDSLMGELKGELTEEEQKALKELKYLDRLAGRKDELAEALKKKIDNGETISQAENTRLDNLAKQIKELEKALDNFNTKQKAKNYIDKQNALKKLRKEIREKQKQKRALKELHEYKGRLVKYLQKKVPKSVAYEYKGMIEAIISMFSDVSGYDNNITYRGKSLTPKEFREAVDRDGSLDELSKYYIRRYEKKSLADYTVEELEHMADVKRRLVDVGRQMWQAKVDARNAEAAQIRQIILNHLRQSPKFSTAPLPDTQEDKKGKKTFRKKFNELFTRTIPMSRITQMLDGNQKGFVYELLTRDKRLVQDMERLAVRERINKVKDLMEELGVKNEDFYQTAELSVRQSDDLSPDSNIEKFTDTYTLSQLIYGLYAQKNARNRLAFMFGDLVTQDDKAALNHNNDLIYDLGMKRNDRFVKQAEAILEKHPKLKQVAEAIVSDWQDMNNKTRLNQVMIDEYNQGLDMEEFYMPIKRLDFNGTSLAQSIADDVFNQNAGKGMTTPKKGMTFARRDITPDQQMRTNMDFLELWLNSVDEQEHLIATNAYVRKLNRVFKGRGNNDLRSAIENVYGKHINEDIDNYINEIANPPATMEDRNVSKWIRFLRGRLYEAYLGFKLSSFVLQVITSPAPFLREVNAIQLSEYILKVMARPSEYWKFIAERSPMMESRSIDPMLADIKKEAEDATANKFVRGYRKTLAFGTGLLEVADRWMVSAGWLACFEKAMNERQGAIENGDITQLQAEVEASRYADEVVLESQPTGDSTELSPMFKTGSAAWQALTQFTTSLNVIWTNLMYDSVSDLRNRNFKRAILTAFAYALAGTVLYAVQDYEPPEDDEHWIKDTILKLLYGMTSQGFSSVPLIGSGIEKFSKQLFTGEKQLMTQRVFPAFETTREALERLAQGKMDEKTVRKAIEAIGLFTGLPVSGTKELEHIFRDRNGNWRYKGKRITDNDILNWIMAEKWQSVVGRRDNYGNKQHRK